MRIVLLVTDHALGGTPLRLARIAEGLQARGIEVHAGCLSAPGEVSEMLMAAGVSTFSVNARSSADLGSISRLTQQIGQIQPDLIHSTLMHANVAARVAGSWLGIPVLASTATIEVRKRWHLWLERLLTPLEAGHLVHSEALRQHVCEQFQIAEERAHVTAPLIRSLKSIERKIAREQLNLPANAWIVGWMGRYDPIKRAEWVVEAVAGLKQEDAIAVLAGAGSDRSRVYAHLNTLGLKDRLIEIGWQSDPSTFYSAIDVFMLPSITEGVPNVALESLSCGVPVVSSRLAALNDVPGVCQIEASNSEHFFSILRRLRDDSEECAQLAAAGQAWTQRALSPNTALDELCALYAKLLNQRSRA